MDAKSFGAFDKMALDEIFRDIGKNLSL